MAKKHAGAGELFKCYSIIDASVLLPKTSRNLLAYDEKHGWIECNFWTDAEIGPVFTPVNDCIYATKILYWQDFPTLNTKDGGQ